MKVIEIFGLNEQEGAGATNKYRKKEEETCGR